MADNDAQTPEETKILCTIEKDPDRKVDSPEPEELIISHLRDAVAALPGVESPQRLEATQQSQAPAEDPTTALTNTYEPETKSEDCAAPISRNRKVSDEHDSPTREKRRSKKRKRSSKKKSRKNTKRRKKTERQPSTGDDKSGPISFTDWNKLLSKHKAQIHCLPDLSDLDEQTVRASSPGIPCPYDDAPSEKSCPASDAEGEDNIDAENEDTAATTEESEEMDVDHDSSFSPSTSPEKEPDTEIIHSEIDRLPVEVRLLIYQQLLVANKDIRVHSGWQLVYKRQGLSIPTAILRTSRRIYSEAVGVLYGYNTFLYRLRDALPTITDVSQLGHIDHDGALPTNDDQDDDDDEYDYDGEESGSEWGGDDNANVTSSAPSRARASRRQTVQPIIEADIHVEKYLHLIRHIVIEAEQNRSSAETKKLMAAAISTFKYQQHSLSNSLMTNIHTLTVRVAPKWDPDGGPTVEDPIYGTVEQHGCFTFVDFFSASSPVIAAIKSVECQFLKVNLMTRYIDGPSARSGYRLLMDLRHLRLKQRLHRHEVQDMWVQDEAMQEERRRKAARAAKALGMLDTHVSQFCERYLEQGTCDDDWDAIADYVIDAEF